MSFKPTAEQLWSEIEAAMRVTAEHMKPADDLLRRLCGRWYRSDRKDMERQPENFGYAYISNMMPQMGLDDPAITCTAARVVGHKAVSQAMEDGINAWIGDSNFAEAHDPISVDFLRIRAVTIHRLKEDGRISRGLSTPEERRIDPGRFFIDALADSPLEAKFMGHWYWVDLDDLLREEDLLPEARATLQPSNDSPEAADTGEEQGHYYKKEGGALERHRVRVYSAWIRESNTMRVVCKGTTPYELFEEQPYYGPEEGPYTLYDAYPIPGQTWPLSPIIAVAEQASDLNIHAISMGESASRRKTIGLVESANTHLGDTLIKAKDGEIHAVSGITGNHVMIEIPGATKDQYAYTEYLRDRLDRISGLTDTVQGNVGQADTATEAKIASDALNLRVLYLKRRMRRATAKGLRKVGWYLFHTDGVVIPVNRRDPYTGEQMEGVFFGGPFPTDGGATWDDFKLAIKLNTMQMEAMRQQNMAAFTDRFLGILPLMAQIPWVRWLNMLRDIASSYDLEDIVDEWVIPEFFGGNPFPPQMPPSQMTGGQAGGPPGLGAPQGQGAPGGPGAPGQAGGEPYSLSDPSNQFTATGVTGPSQASVDRGRQNVYSS